MNMSLMERGQGALEYLIILAAVIAVAAVAIIFVTGAMGAQEERATLSRCRQAAADCRAQLLISPGAECQACYDACLDEDGEPIVPGALEYCLAGEPEKITPTGNYTLTVKIEGEGTVTANEETIEDEKTLEVEQDTEITLTANPSTDWYFDKWTGDHEDYNKETTIIMDSDKQVTANFKEFTGNEEHVLSMRKNGEGTTTPEVGNHPYEHGETVHINATPATEWYFKEWAGDHESASETATIEVDSDKEVTAHFKEKDPGIEYYDLTINIEGEGTTNPETGTYEYEEGEEVGITAEANEGHEFVEWTGNIENIDEPSSPDTTITMEGHYSITANFQEDDEPEGNKLTINIQGDGTVTANEETVQDGVPIFYDEGTEVHLNATTEDDEESGFIKWKGLDADKMYDREIYSDNGITMEDNYTITAEFGDFNIIETKEDLEDVTENPTENYKVVNDISAGSFEPITGFKGTFDGKGHTITFSQSDDYYVGLFATLYSGGVVKNLNLDASVTAENWVGGLAGQNNGVIYNSYVTGSITGEGRDVGGLVGDNRGDIYDSHSSASVEATGGVGGGLVGTNTGDIIESYATGKVTGQDIFGVAVGGLVGRNGFAHTPGHVENSYATGSVTGTGWSVGGLVGSNNGDVSGSYATGSVNGDNYVAGLVGYNNGDVSDSYATGSVTGEGSRVGGLAGYNAGDGVVSGSYATGSVTGDRVVGGLVGYNAGGSVSGSYATGSVTGEGSRVGGLVGSTYGSSPIVNSFASGDVLGERDVGGLVGAHRNGSIVNNSYATGSVEGDRTVGGLVGVSGIVLGGEQKHPGYVSNSYSIGQVIDAAGNDGDIGGLIGSNEFGEIEKSYWDTEESGIDQSDGGEGRNTDDMTYTYSGDTYVDWDFDDVWLDGYHGLVEGENYPALQWQE